MASLKLDHIYKVYPNGTKAVNDFHMDIKDGEFIVFVGPSGCGKSTTLRMIAGLEEISSGELYIGDTLVNDMEPKDRDIAMVFQNYALYPHMTVYENMAFGLTLRHMPRNEIHEKVMWAADILGLKDYLDRKPKAMSGGQRQRVSLGRAILRNPKVMLLDEPLSNLDAKLRSQMRSEISKLHQSLKTTFIYVTHDQVEAMTLGTRVVVMKLGRIQQVDTPKNLYDDPVNVFVAGFIGTPQMNFFNVNLLKKADNVEVSFVDAEQPKLKCPFNSVIKAKKHYLDGKYPLIFGIRCEDLSVEEADVAKGDNIINVTVSHFEELGNETLIYGDLGKASGKFGDNKTSVIIKSTSNHGFKPGDVVPCRVNLDRGHFFDSKTEMTILPRIPADMNLPVTIKGGKLALLGKTIEAPAALKEKAFEGTAIVPIEAIKAGTTYSARVIRSEKVADDKYLVYLEQGDEIFFALTAEKHNANAKFAFDIDYEKIAFVNADETVEIAPLVERDNVVASFVNLKTASSKTQNPEFEQVQRTRVEAATKEFDEKLAALAAEKEAAIAAVDLSNIEAVRAENKATLDAFKKEKSAEFAKEKAEYKKNSATAKKAYNAKVKEIKAAVNKEYGDMLAKEKADYMASMEINKDPDSRRARKALFDSFKETLPAAKANDLKNRLNSASFDYETEKSAISSRFTRAKFDYTSAIKNKEEELNRTSMPVETLTKEYDDKMAALNKEKDAAVLSASLIFFFDFDGHYQIIPDNITNKIIQGLGSKAFTKTYKICIPHASYRIEEKGIGVEVREIVDYVSHKYYKCVAKMYGQEFTLFVEGGNEFKVGDHFFVEPDLEETEIYETALNIRLY